LQLGQFKVEGSYQWLSLDFEDDRLVIDSAVELELLEEGEGISTGMIVCGGGLGLLVAIGVGLEVGIASFAVEPAKNHLGIVFIFVHAGSNLNC